MCIRDSNNHGMLRMMMMMRDSAEISPTNETQTADLTESKQGRIYIRQRRMTCQYHISHVNIISSSIVRGMTQSGPNMGTQCMMALNNCSIEQQGISTRINGTK